jgi:hypothetical protein
VRSAAVAVFVGSLSLSHSGLAAAMPLQATADYEMFYDGQIVARGKLYAAGDRFRLEPGDGAIVADGTRNELWMIRHSGNCEAQPFDAFSRNQFPWLASHGAKERYVASETIDGHPTKKYERQWTWNPTGGAHYVWRATDLKGFPILIVDEAERVKRTLRNVAFGKPEAKRFDPPPQCHATSNPSDTTPGSTTRRKDSP